MSVGIVKGRTGVDLAYEEDVAAEVDMNLVMNSQGEFIELQGTAERRAFTREQLNSMLVVRRRGIEKLFELQNAALKES